ncbi:MAG: hypothetical protein ACYC4U_09475 [Pirellulaceae bacterium]
MGMHAQKEQDIEATFLGCRFLFYDLAGHRVNAPHHPAMNRWAIFGCP